MTCSDAIVHRAWVLMTVFLNWTYSCLHSVIQPEQLSTEYRILVKQHHPDKNLETKNSEEFLLLQSAKEILLDPELRPAYDKWLACGIAMPFDKWMNLSKSGHAFHWVNSRSTTMKLEGSSKSTETSDSTSAQNVDAWQRETPSEALRKFRTYEIWWETVKISMV